MTDNAVILLIIVATLACAGIYTALGVGVAKAAVGLGYQKTIQLRHVLLWWLYLAELAVTDKIEQ